MSINQGLWTSFKIERPFPLAMTSLLWLRIYIGTRVGQKFVQWPNKFKPLSTTYQSHDDHSNLQMTLIPSIPIGQNQVLPYIFYLSKKTFHSHIHHNRNQNWSQIPRCAIFKSQGWILACSDPTSIESQTITIMPLSKHYILLGGLSL